MNNDARNKIICFIDDKPQRLVPVLKNLYNYVRNFKDVEITFKVVAIKNYEKEKPEYINKEDKSIESILSEANMNSEKGEYYKKINPTVYDLYSNDSDNRLIDASKKIKQEIYEFIHVDNSTEFIILLDLELIKSDDYFRLAKKDQVLSMALYKEFLPNCMLYTDYTEEEIKSDWEETYERIYSIDKSRIKPDIIVKDHLKSETFKGDIADSIFEQMKPLSELRL